MGETAGSQQRWSRRPVLGWREWVGLPDLGINRIKAKVDTGARTSALHAFAVKRFTQDGVEFVRFRVHPIQRNTVHTATAEAPLVDERWVRSSTGQRQLRPVVHTLLSIGETTFPIELTLTSRDLMSFRLLLGRESIRHRFVVDPGHSHLIR